MHQLLPEPLAQIDPAVAVAELTERSEAGFGRQSTVTLNMVASVDGATAIDGRSGALGGPADRLVFRALRDLADVILVAAGTVRAEGYGPPRTPESAQERRRRRGQALHPRLAVVSGSLDLDPTARLFADATDAPLVLTADDASPSAVAALEPVAEVVRLGPAPLSARAIVDALLARDLRRVLCEGGPTLNGQLVAADLVDVVHLTLSPTLVGGDSLRVTADGDPVLLGMALTALWHDEDDDLLFARYERTRNR